MTELLMMLIGAAGGIGWSVFRLKPEDASLTETIRRVVPFSGPGPWRPPK